MVEAEPGSWVEKQKWLPMSLFPSEVLPLCGRSPARSAGLTLQFCLLGQAGPPAPGQGEKAEETLQAAGVPGSNTLYGHLKPGQLCWTAWEPEVRRLGWKSGSTP